MCESTVYIEDNGEKIEFMKEVAKIEFTNEAVICYDIIGEKREIPGGKIILADLMNHSIIVAK